MGGGGEWSKLECFPLTPGGLKIKAISEGRYMTGQACLDRW